MFRAYAAENGAAQEAFYAAGEFWVAIAFLILIAAVVKPVWKFVTKALDDKIAEIQTKIEEATQLREEAQALLAEYKRKLTEAEKEAEEIVSDAREEAQKLRAKLTAELEGSLQRRERQAQDRIAQAEAEAISEVRAFASDVALETTRNLLEKEVTGAKADSLVDDAIGELPGKLN